MLLIIMLGMPCKKKFNHSLFYTIASCIHYIMIIYHIHAFMHKHMLRILVRFDFKLYYATCSGIDVDLAESTRLYLTIHTS